MVDAPSDGVATVGLVLLRRILRSTRDRTAKPPPSEADRLLRIYQTTHADMRELLDEAREPRRAAA